MSKVGLQAFRSLPYPSLFSRLSLSLSLSFSLSPSLSLSLFPFLSEEAIQVVSRSGMARTPARSAGSRYDLLGKISCARALRAGCKRATKKFKKKCTQTTEKKSLFLCSPRAFFFFFCGPLAARAQRPRTRYFADQVIARPRRPCTRIRFSKLKLKKSHSNFSVQRALADQKRNERPSTLDNIFISGPHGSSLS